MIGFKTIITSALVSLAAITSASAQLPDWAASDPGAFEAQYPDRDVLNGGALTPAGRMGLELPGGAAPAFGTSNDYRATGRANFSATAVGGHAANPAHVKVRPDVQTGIVHRLGVAEQRRRRLVR